MAILVRQRTANACNDALLDKEEYRFEDESTMRAKRRSSVGLLKTVAVAICLVILLVLSRGHKKHVTREHRIAQLIDGDMTFTGPFARFSELEDLPSEYRKLNLISVWNNDRVPQYMRHFFYSVGQNNATVDLLLINRRLKDTDRCADFSVVGIDPKAIPNIKIVCLSPQEWRERQIDFMCSPTTGWSCTEAERIEILAEFGIAGKTFYDHRNYDLRPIQGYVYKDLFVHQRPLWAWVDTDMILGRMDLFPLNIAAKLSILSAQPGTAFFSFMQGQFCILNFDDTLLMSAWKHIQQYRSVEMFLSFIRSGDALKMKNMFIVSEEHAWSTAYSGLQDDQVGRQLSYANLPEFHGDDFFESPHVTKDLSVFVVSGREMLLIEKYEGREAIEHTLHQASLLVDDNVRNAGWTKGEDGSSLMIDSPFLTQDQAHSQLNTPSQDRSSAKLETISYQQESGKEWLMELHVPHHMFRGYESNMRASLIHFKEHNDRFLFQRLEIDKRPRGYSRKLWKHHLTQKHKKEFALPDFDLTDDIVLVFHSAGIFAFKKGSEREKDIYTRTYSFS